MNLGIWFPNGTAQAKSGVVASLVMLERATAAATCLTSTSSCIQGKASPLFSKHTWDAMSEEPLTEVYVAFVIMYGWSEVHCGSNAGERMWLQPKRPKQID